MLPQHALCSSSLVYCSRLLSCYWRHQRICDSQGGAQLPLPGAESAPALPLSAHGVNGAGPGPISQAKESLLAAAAKARKEKPAETEAEKMLKEEQEIMRNITSRKALKSVMENAQVRVLEPIELGHAEGAFGKWAICMALLIVFVTSLFEQEQLAYSELDLVLVCRALSTRGT